MRVLVFSTTLSEMLLILSKIQRDIVVNVTGYSRQVSVIFFRI